MNPEITKSESMRQLSLELIVGKLQARQLFDEKPIAAIAASMKEVGQLSPIRVVFDRDLFTIVDGELRFRAAQSLGWTTITAIVEERPLSEAEILQMQLIANCQRKNLTPLEKGRAISRLKAMTNWSISEVAFHLSMSIAMVTKSLKVLTLPKETLDLVEAGRIPVSAAYELTKIKDPEQQLSMTHRIIEGGLTRDVINGLSRKKTSGAKPCRTTRRAVAHLDGSRSVTVVGDSMSLDNLIGSLEELLAKARRARTQGLVLQTFTKMLRDQVKT